METTVPSTSATVPTAPSHPVEHRKPRIRVAAVQTLIAAGADVVAPTVSQIEAAAAQGCDLIAFPEYHLGHLKADGPELAAICAAAAEHRINVVVGAWEDFAPGDFANTAFVINRSGEIVGRFNKAHAAVGSDPHSWPPHGHEEEWHMRLGQGFPVFDLDFGRIGVMTCYDGYFPESAHCLSLSGAEVIVWINGRYGSIEDYLVKAYMFTGFTHLIACNQSTGAGTMIGHFPNRILEETKQPNKDYLLVAELDLEMLREHRVNARMFHQRRPALYGALGQRHKIWENYPDMQQPPTLEDLEARRTSPLGAAASGLAE